MADLKLDSNVTIGSQNPIQGSVSLSRDDSNISIARYEGGDIAGVKGQAEYVLKWQTFGKSTGSVSTGTTITMAVGTTTLSIKGVYKVSCGWSSEWGFITDHEITGKESTGT